MISFNSRSVSLFVLPSLTLFSACGSFQNEKHSRWESVSSLSTPVTYTCESVKVKSQEVIDGKGTTVLFQECLVTSEKGADYAKLLSAFVKQASTQGELLEAPTPLLEGGLTGQQLKNKVTAKSLLGELVRVQKVSAVSNGSSLLKSLSQSESVTGTGTAGLVQSVSNFADITGLATGSDFKLTVTSELTAKKPVLVGEATFLGMMIKSQTKEVEEGVSELLKDVIVPSLAPSAISL